MLFSFGSNGNGQISLGHTEDTHVPTPCRVPADFPTLPPKQIVAGGNHTLVLFSSGRLFATGSNKYGQCGIRTSFCDSLLSFQEVPSPPDKNPDSKWALVSAGWDFSILVSDQGEIYSCGNGPKGELGLGISNCSAELTKIMPFSETRITSLASGMAHTVVLLESGEVYGWGAARKGQIGHPIEKAIFEPRKIELSFPAFGVVCGREFSFVVSRDGYQHAILGDDGRFSIRAGAPIEGDLKGWKKIGASWSTVIVLLQDGSVRAWGRNDKGQIPSKNMSNVKDIAIGSEHGVALAVVKGAEKLVAWGWGEHGNCGKMKNDGGGNVVGEIFEVPFPSNHLCFRFIGAGCATSWAWIDHHT
jgi:protein ATS1